MTTTVLPTVRAPRWRQFAVWSGPALLVVGFFVEKFWTSFPAPRAVEMTVLIALVLGLAEMVRRALRWRLATSLAMVFFIALTVFAGPSAVLAAVLLVAASACIGAAIGPGHADALAALVGLSVITGLIGWLLPFPVHWRWAYLAVLVVPIIVWRAAVIETSRHVAESWRAAVDASPRTAAFAVLAVGICSTGCWLPTMQYDDLAYHLGLPSQPSTLHYYRLDAHSQMWALAPWSGDIAQAVAQILADGETRGAVDAVWLLAIATLTWRLCGLLDASATTRWLAVAIAASQPLLASLCAGMQSELPATAAALALAVAVLDRSMQSPNADAARFACLAALLLGLKTGFVAIVLPLAIAYAWTRRARGVSMRTLLASALCIVLCGSSYFYATLLTGDPFFPLFANVFHTRYPAPDMNDLRWHGDIGATALWQLTFRTAAYHEGWNGAAGASMLGLAGASLLALFIPRTRIVAVCALVSFAVAIGTVHYLRYAFPAATLLIAPSVTALAQTVSQRRVVALACVLVVVNMAYQSCASWVLHVGGIKRRVMETDAQLFERFAPTRNLVRGLDRESNVLFCSIDDPAHAELAGRGFTVAHYDIELERERIVAEADLSGAAWRTLFQRTQARYAIVSLKDSDTPALHAALSDAKLIREEHARQLWELPRAPSSDDLVRSRDAARRLWP